MECIHLLAGVALQVVRLFSVRQTLDVRMADASLLAALAGGGLLILPIPLGLPLLSTRVGLLILPLLSTRVGLLILPLLSTRVGLLILPLLLGLLGLPLLSTRAGLTLVVVGGPSLPLPLRHTQAGPTQEEAGQDLVSVELPVRIRGEEVARVRQMANVLLLLCLLIVVAREEVVVDAESLAR